MFEIIVIIIINDKFYFKNFFLLSGLNLIYMFLLFLLVFILWNWWYFFKVKFIFMIYKDIFRLNGKILCMCRKYLSGKISDK